jgi:hypothetical protein
MRTGAVAQRLAIGGIFTAVLGLVLVGTSQEVSAQLLYSELIGKVVDAQGAVIPGATVTLNRIDVPQGAGRDFTVVSNERGTFNIRSIFPGRYRITVSLEGFREFVNELNLEIGRTLNVCSTLEVGALSETIGVTAREETQSIIPGIYIRTAELSSMPLNRWRDYRTLASIVPTSEKRIPKTGGYDIDKLPFAWNYVQDRVQARFEWAYRKPDVNPPPLFRTNIRPEMCANITYRIQIELSPDRVKPGSALSTKVTGPPDAFDIKNSWPDEQRMTATGAVFVSYVKPKKAGRYELRVVVAEIVQNVPSVIAVSVYTVTVIASTFDDLFEFFTSNWQQLITLPFLSAGAAALYNWWRRVRSRKQKNSKTPFERTTRPSSAKLSGCSIAACRC